MWTSLPPFSLPPQLEFNRKPQHLIDLTLSLSFSVLCSCFVIPCLFLMYLTVVQLMPSGGRTCLWLCVRCTLWCELYSQGMTYSNPLRPYRDIDSFFLPDWRPVTFHREQNYKDREAHHILLRNQQRTCRVKTVRAGSFRKVRINLPICVQCI